MACDRWVVVVPCYNEASRLPVDRYLEWLSGCENATLLFVDDGSCDGTDEVLRALASGARGRAHVLTLPRNAGKAEAVRQGMLRALDFQPLVVAYWDADLATPLGALSDFEKLLEAQPEIDIALGTRVRLLGHDIRRCATRHYFGRVFATAASLVLNLPVYDTQCGAKVFKSHCVRQIFAEPFHTHWVFDVELLARCLVARGAQDPEAPLRICEMPLRAWYDVPGSKVRPVDAIRAFVDLARIYRMIHRELRPGGPLPAGRPSMARSH
jgi:dolichyl-phosphate beta-glucosyltransferase